MNAAVICARLGGGGHPAAAGCTLEGDLESAKQTRRAVVEDALRQADVLRT